METILYEGIELLPVKSDVVFKAVFGKEESRDILAVFLRDVLELDIEKPEDIELLNTELSPEYYEDKLSRLDIRIKTSRNTHIDIEIQLINWNDMIPRSIYYACRLMSAQMKEGNPYQNLGRVVALNILDFQLFQNNREYFNQYWLKNGRTHEVLTDILEIDFLELPKVALSATGNTKRDIWAKFLSAKKEEELKMLENQDNIIQKAVDRLKSISADDETRILFQQREEARIDYYARLNGVREQGIQIGQQQGVDKMSLLFHCLIQDKRMEDLERAAIDKDFRKALLSEYHIM